MKTHRYCFPMRIVAMLLVLILCLDFSGASVFAAEKPQQSDTEKELALDWLTEMTGSREEAELFYARMDALGLLNGDLEPGASKLTIAGKDYTLEEAKAVLDSFADDESVSDDTVKYNSLNAKMAADGITPLAAFSFLLFVLLYFPCIATIAAIKGETGSWKWALFAALYTTAVAWIVSTLVFQLGSLF